MQNSIERDAKLFIPCACGRQRAPSVSGICTWRTRCNQTMVGNVAFACESIEWRVECAIVARRKLDFDTATTMHMRRMHSQQLPTIDRFIFSRPMSVPKNSYQFYINQTNTHVRWMSGLTEWMEAKRMQHFDLPHQIIKFKRKHFNFMDQ